MNLFQIIFASLILVSLSRTILKLKEGTLSITESVFWMMIWGTGVALIIHPQTSTRLANILGIGRGVDVIIYTSIILIFYALYKIYIKISEQNQKLKRLNTEITLLKEKNK